MMINTNEQDIEYALENFETRIKDIKENVHRRDCEIDISQPISAEEVLVIIDNKIKY